VLRYRISDCDIQPLVSEPNQAAIPKKAKGAAGRPLLYILELRKGPNHLVVHDFQFFPEGFKKPCSRVDASIVSTFVAEKSRPKKKTPGVNVVMVKIQNNGLSVLVIALFMFSAASVRSSAQTVKSQIQRMTGWQSCAACAGANGAGPRATLSTVSGVKSPSMSGNSRMFYIASGSSYADGLWWKQLGAANGATNLRYDVYFYLQAPQYSQALEFDNNQANGKKRWIFGTQCNIGAGHWDVWGNANGNWISTGIPCRVPSAYKWHHLIWEFKRTAYQVTYVAFTLDGVKHYVNRTYTARASSVNELNVAFQMDMKKAHVAYKTWLDNVKLTYW
jgi:hypothetical protein